MHLSPHEWTWTQAEQEAIAQALIERDAELQWLSDNCRMIYFPTDGSYPLEHQPHVGKFQFDAIMEQRRLELAKKRPT